jgi:hypothetical protein
MKGGYGFPGEPSVQADNRSNNKPAYRADLSKHKQNLLDILKKSEQLWNDDRAEESSIQLRKAITTIEFIVQNESIGSIKAEYELKLNELKGRLTSRSEGKEVPQNYAETKGRNTRNGKNKEEDNFQQQLNDAIVIEKPNVSWEDVSGL